MGFAAGYGMAMISYVQFYYVCEFGEEVEVRWIVEKGLWYAE